MSKITFPVAVIAVALTVVNKMRTEAVCDPYLGPSGSMDCVDIPVYDTHQLGTCLSDTYIRLKSKGFYQCDDPRITYCYYQCMVEIHGSTNGNVTIDCACQPSANSSTTPVADNETTIDQACFSPSGEDCHWYSICMKSNFPCLDDSDDYGIDHAHAFCSLYAEDLNNFSAAAQPWVEAVGKCLQVEMAPLLRPFHVITCQDVRTHAFKSHSECYLHPYRNVTSYCNLTSADLWHVFWSVKKAMETEFTESLIGYIKVSKNCPNDPIQPIDTNMQLLKLTLQLEREWILQWYENKIQREKRDTVSPLKLTDNAPSTSDSNIRTERQSPVELWQGETPTQLLFHWLASQATRSLGGQLGWDNNSLMTFAYGQQTDNETMDVRVLLADRFAYVTDVTLQSSADLSAVAEAAVEEVGKRRVVVTVDGKSVPILELMVCRTVDCHQVQVVVTTKAPNVAADLGLGFEIAVHGVAVGVLVYFMI